MTTTGYKNAKDEMFALFNTAWAAGSGAIVGGVAPEIRWPLDEKPDPTDFSLYWARVSTQLVVADQAALGNGEDGGKILYASAGLIFVQCFGPVGDKQVGVRLPALAELAKNSFRGKKTASGVWFRNCRTLEVGAADKWQQIKAIAEFQFQEIG